MTKAEPYIKIQNITKCFGKLRALHNINLEVEKGEYVVILGPTGAGKTTLLKIIAGLIKPTQGKVYKNGELLTRVVPPEKRNVAYLPQTSDYSLFQYMNVWENTTFSPRMKGEKSREEIIAIADEILDMVNLRFRYNAYPNELSGGMKQRVALARAMAADADVFLFDEPLRALDARLRIQLRTEIRKLVSDLDKTTFHVTHDQEEATAIADKVLIMNEGSIIQYDIPEEIYNHPNSLFSAYFFGETNLFPATMLKADSINVTCRVGEFLFDISIKNCFMNYNKENNSPEREVVLSVKADRIIIMLHKDNVTREDSESVILDGAIEETFFLGKWASIDVKVAGFTEKCVQVIIPSTDLPEYEIGTKVRLKIPLDTISCFHEPWDTIKQLEAV